MEVKFWGVRGSIPCPGAHTIKYGGNTSCIELRFDDLGRIIIIDAGTGIRELGDHLATRKYCGTPLTAEIFLTHTHWDHIQGFPFFAPLYDAGTKFTIYGPATFEDKNLEEAMAGQLTYRHFPVRLAELTCELEYVDLKEGCLDLGDGITLKTKLLNHPTLCLGYRFEYNGKVLCTAYDTEPYQNLFSADADSPHYDEFAIEEGDRAAREGNRGLLEFCSGADLMIHDAQYSQDEYNASKTGWGHTSFEQAIAHGKEAGIKHLALFHHDPKRTDEELDGLSEKYCHPSITGDMDIFFAREGMRVAI